MTDPNIHRPMVYATGMMAEKEIETLQLDWKWQALESFKQDWFPEGIPCDIDLNEAWTYLACSSMQKLADHVHWKDMRPGWNALLNWISSSHWKQDRDRKGMFPAFGNAPAILACLVLANWQRRKNATMKPETMVPALMKEVWDKCSLNFIVQHPENREYVPYWVGADLFDPEWYQHHITALSLWTSVYIAPKVDLNISFQKPQTDRQLVPAKRELDQPSVGSDDESRKKAKLTDGQSEETEKMQSENETLRMQQQIETLQQQNAALKEELKFAVHVVHHHKSERKKVVHELEECRKRMDKYVSFAIRTIYPVDRLIKHQFEPSLVKKEDLMELGLGEHQLEEEEDVIINVPKYDLTQVHVLVDDGEVVRLHQDCRTSRKRGRTRKTKPKLGNNNACAQKRLLTSWPRSSDKCIACNGSIASQQQIRNCSPLRTFSVQERHSRTIRAYSAQERHSTTI